MARHDTVHFVPDPRSIQVESGRSLHDYLQAVTGARPCPIFPRKSPWRCPRNIPQAPPIGQPIPLLVPTPASSHDPRAGVIIPDRDWTRATFHNPHCLRPTTLRPRRNVPRLRGPAASAACACPSGVAHVPTDIKCRPIGRACVPGRAARSSCDKYGHCGCVPLQRIRAQAPGP